LLPKPRRELHPNRVIARFINHQQEGPVLELHPVAFHRLHVGQRNTAGQQFRRGTARVRDASGCRQNEFRCVLAEHAIELEVAKRNPSGFGVAQTNSQRQFVRHALDPERRRQAVGVARQVLRQQPRPNRDQPARAARVHLQLGNGIDAQMAAQ